MSLSCGGLCSYANAIFKPTGEMLPAVGDLKLYKSCLPELPLYRRKTGSPVLRVSQHVCPTCSRTQLLTGAKEIFLFLENFELVLREEYLLCTTVRKASSGGDLEN